MHSHVTLSLVCEEGGDSWRYSFRPCCETLFLTLIHEFRGVLVPCLVGVVHENAAPVPPADLAAILYKDAVYNAAGLAAFDLYDEVGQRLILGQRLLCTSS